MDVDGHDAGRSSRAKRLRILLTVAGLGFGVPAILLAVSSMSGSFPIVAAESGLSPIFIVLVAGPLSFPVHELGHLMAGSAVRFQFLGIGLGPVALQRADGRLRMSVQRTPALWGGYAVAAPRSGDTAHLRKRLLIYAAGGPAMSFMVGTLALAFAMALPAEGFAALVLLLKTFGAVSLGLFVATVLPVHAAPGIPSDGLRIAELATRAEYSPAEAATFVAGTG